MLSRNLLSKFGTHHVRRSLVQCAVSYETESSVVVINASNHQKEDEKKSRTKMLPVISGAVLGATVLSHNDSEDHVEGSAEQNSSKTSFQSLASFLPVLNAAEPVDSGQENESPSPPVSKPMSRRNKFNFIADLVEETAPGLVCIEIKDTGVRDYFTGQPVTSSNGSGFIVGSDGLILTNAHVVINKPRANILVRLQDGRVFAGTVEDVDVKSDLATLRIPCKNLPQMKLGSSSDIRPGEWVVAMGSPLALSNTITTGVVSNIARPPDELGLQGRDVPDYIQTDAAITFGNSGGPLINLDGEAIGINSMKVTPGISFAIPIDYAKEFLKKSAEAQKKGGGLDNSRRYIGITMVTLNPQIIDELKVRIQVPQNVSHGIIIYR